MKLSRNWLKRYLDLPYPDEELAEMLTTIGLEVEGIEYVESIRGGLQGVVVGLVKTCEKHPDADKLSVTKVDIGSGTDLDIVCGAPNVAAGHKVLVATVGTTIYLEDDSFKIKKAKIRGCTSEGMICAEDELGLGKSHDGIMVLDSNVEVGKAAAELFDLTTDTVFDIGLTPNRSDATSQFGVAKDLYAYVKVNKGDDFFLKEPNSGDFHINNTAERFEIEVLNQDACPRYSGLVINNITIGESPDWLKKLLKAIGVKPINNVVDVTNFILHELGQPLHAFDANKINDGKIIVQTLKDNQKFVTLDDREIKLTQNDLMICDGDGNGMCIAGVFGGNNSGVTNSTTKLFLESAYFEASSIRKTSMHHNLRTDAAKVYEKGADPNITVAALKRAAMLICELTGGVVSSEIIDIYPKEIKPAQVRLRYNRVNEVIGHKLEQVDIHNILNALDMEISPVDQDSIKVNVPTNKFDVTREIDLIEEVLRIYGFNEVPIPTLVKSNINYSENPNKNDIKNLVGDVLSNTGFNEIMGLSLVESVQCKEWLNFDEEDLVLINNTSNIHLDAMRPDMLLSGAISILHNLNRQQTNIKLFEFGKTYLKANSEFQETEYFTIFMSGNESNASWNQKEVSTDYYSIKGAVHAVLEALGITNYQEKVVEDERFYYGLEYHRGPQALVSFGEVSRRFLKNTGIKQPIYFAEFTLANVLNAVKNVSVSINDISKFPSVKRDLALVLDDKITFDQVEALAKRTIKQNLSDISLFDVFKSEEHLGKGKKSYAISLTFESLEKTLKDTDVESWMSSLINKYEKKLGAIIRK